ncbi:hypothetical protein Fcan01_23773 [Folsomia candida]|uniref:Uncharacterized protein n=1 Tax=Folsomia candida TaxID=158441 RepID=A0A226DA23_FOLCA|nr:hypothetical protein Fcan01_23773 [Folsomia candida]
MNSVDSFVKPYAMPYKSFLYKSVTYNYISCYKEERIAYAIYLQPFDLSSWIFVAVTILMVSLLTDIYIRYYLGIRSVPSSLLYYLGNILDEPSNPSSSKVGDKTAFRTGSICYLLMTVVLSNGYINFLITKVNGPLPPKIFDTIKSLYCQDFNSSFDNEEVVEINESWRYRYDGDDDVKIFKELHQKSDCFSLLSYKMVMKKVFRENTFFIIKLFQHLFVNNSQASKEFFLMYSQNKMRWYPKKLWDLVNDDMVNENETISISKINEWAIEELLDCGKSVYFTESEVFTLLKQYFEKNLPNINFYVGKELLSPNSIYLNLYISKYSKVPKLLNSVMESNLVGNKYFKEVEIIEEITKNLFEKNRTRYDKIKKPKRLPLESSLLTVFRIFAISLGISIVCLFLEVGKHLPKVYRDWGNKIIKCILHALPKRWKYILFTELVFLLRLILKGLLKRETPL